MAVRIQAGVRFSPNFGRAEAGVELVEDHGFDLCAGGQVTSFVSWSTVNARTPNIRWHMALVGPRTRTWLPPN
jgi:hypothetical protein